MFAENGGHPSEELFELLLMLIPNAVDLIEELEGGKGKGGSRIAILNSLGKWKWMIHIFPAMIPMRYT